MVRLTVSCTLLLASVWLVMVHSAMAGTVTIRPGDTRLEFGHTLEILATDDPALARTPAEINAAPGFKQSDSASPTLGLTRQTVWARFSVLRQPGAEPDWFMVLRHGMLENATLFTRQDDGSWRGVDAGSALPPDLRPVNHRHIVFRPDLPAGQETLFLIRLHTHGSVQFPLELASAERFAARNYLEQLAYGLAFGTALAIGLYLYIMFGVALDRTYLWLGTATLLYGLYQFNQFGFLRLLPLGSGAMPIQAISAVTPPLALFCFMRFFRLYIDTGNRMPRLAAALGAIQIACLVSLVSLFVLGPQPSHYANLFIALVALILSLATTLTAFARAPRQYGFFLAGWFLYLIGLPIFLLRLLGVQIPVADQPLLQAGGFALGSIFWAAALAERLKAQRDQQESRLRASEANLERQVGDRTAELRQRNREMTQAVEELLAAKQAAEDASRAKDNFLAHMSHELRTPLNAILGFSEVIRDQLLGRDAQARYREYAGDIHGSGTHLLNLVNDILDLSKIEAGKFELYKELIDGGHIVEECVSMMRAAAESGGVDLQLVPPPRAPLFVDDRAFKQIVLNLLSNAVKFTPSGGTVTVELTYDSALFTLAVTDTGIGMSDLTRAVAFEPFRRGDVSTASKFKGTGLGLAISRELARLLGGDLLIESEIGRGTIATLRLPVQIAQ